MSGDSVSIVEAGKDVWSLCVLAKAHPSYHAHSALVLPRVRWACGSKGRYRARLKSSFVVLFGTVRRRQTWPGCSWKGGQFVDDEPVIVFSNSSTKCCPPSEGVVQELRSLSGVQSWVV